MKKTKLQLLIESEDRVRENLLHVRQKIKNYLEGRNVKILSDYNGQPFGNSKPSLKNKILSIEGVVFDDDGSIDLWFDYEKCTIPLGEVEITVPGD